MKKYLLVIITLFVLFACSDEEQKLEVYSPEAFAFKVGTEWELNASAQVKGFKQVEEGLEYSTKLSYFVNLTTPQEELLEEVDYGMINQKTEEELLDVQIGMQIILDSSFVTGDYTLQLIVMDDYSEQQDSTSVNFTLSE